MGTFTVALGGHNVSGLREQPEAYKRLTFTVTLGTQKSTHPHWLAETPFLAWYWRLNFVLISTILDRYCFASYPVYA